MGDIVAGIDVGSLCTKVVLLDGQGEILSYKIIRSGASYQGAAEASFNEALTVANLDLAAINYIIATGYGRARVSFAHHHVTEITCHARGAKSIFPQVRTVIDIGGQDSKVIYVNEDGRPVNFIMNDKCAAGTGRFLEVMAGALEVDLDEMGAMSLRAQTETKVSNMCTVFAETEVISLLAQGCDKADIAAGIYEAIARRITGMVGQLGLKEPVVMTGGVAKSKGMVRALEKKLGAELLIPQEPQIIGALGAAIIAREQ
jgi:predicted CoA-substrate-specific enzyme activase